MTGNDNSGNERTNPIPTAPDPSLRCPECNTPGKYFKGSEKDCPPESCDVVTFDRDGNVTYPDDWSGAGNTATGTEGGQRDV